MLSFKDVTLDDALSRGLHSVEEQQEIKKYIICKVKIRAVEKKKAKEGGQEHRWAVNGGGQAVWGRPYRCDDGGTEA